MTDTPAKSECTAGASNALPAVTSADLQRNNPNWFKDRLFRLTSSQFYDIIHGEKPKKRRGGRTIPMHLDPNRLHWKGNKDPYVQEMIDWGITHEENALKTVGQALGKELLPAGFCVSSDYSFLGASPDAFVPGRKTGKPIAAVEVKCPWSVRYSGNPPKYVIISARDKKTYKLSTSHKYYYQIQGQLFVCGLQQAVFAAWTPLRTYVMRVDRDDSFIQTMVKSLVCYYVRIYVPYLIKNNQLKDIPESDRKALEKARRELDAKK